MIRVLHPPNPKAQQYEALVSHTYATLTLTQFIGSFHSSVFLIGKSIQRRGFRHQVMYHGTTVNRALKRIFAMVASCVDRIPLLHDHIRCRGGCRSNLLQHSLLLSFCLTAQSFLSLSISGNVGT